MSIPENAITPEIEKLINKLIREDGTELDAYLTQITTHTKVVGTQTKVHCYMVGHDGNDNPRVNDLAMAVAARIIDYSIPRSEILKAQQIDRKKNTTVATSMLKMKAKKLFTSLKKSGEGGEMLLYMLIQCYLGLPQLLCKMPLKTSSEVHYHGADGIHVGYDTKTRKLALYWGESKLHQSIDQAISTCLDSISPFLLDTGGINARQTRDLQLITSNLDVCDSDLEEAILHYLDPNDPSFKKMQYRAACLIGFDEKSYPTGPNTKTEEDVLNEINQAFVKWNSKLSKKIQNRKPLDNFIIEVFLVPFPSVQTFRDEFIEAITYV